LIAKAGLITNIWCGCGWVLYLMGDPCMHTGTDPGTGRHVSLKMTSTTSQPSGDKHLPSLAQGVAKLTTASVHGCGTAWECKFTSYPLRTTLPI